MSTTSEVTLAAAQWTAIASTSGADIVVVMQAKGRDNVFMFKAASSLPAASDTVGLTRKLSRDDITTVAIADGENLYGRPLANEAVDLIAWVE